MADRLLEGYVEDEDEAGDIATVVKDLIVKHGGSVSMAWQVEEDLLEALGHPQEDEE